MSNKTSKKKVVTTKKTVTTARKKITPTSRTRSGSSQKSSEPIALTFSKQSYIWMGIGMALVALGLIMMIGGKMPSPDVWDENIIYNPRIMVVGPILILAGLIVEIYAIFKK